MRSFGLVSLVFLAACSGETGPACGAFDEEFVYVDLDGDGFGTDPIGWTCEAKPGEATSANDCNDDPQNNGAAEFPGAEEICDLVDNDCDGLVDEDSIQYAWFRDDDGDGYGANGENTLGCQAPGATFVSVSGDCDDTLPAVSPAALEVCNELDDDCDGFVDDADGGVDPTTQVPWYRDVDGDGYGYQSVMACKAPNDMFVELGNDCDEDNANIHPAAIERCNRIDDDCDTLTDDEDSYVDPTDQTEYFNDGDLDGYGDPIVMTLACEPSPGAVTNGDDCDDGDPLATVARDWVTDLDLDGVGVGASVAFECHQPSPDTAPMEAGTDCDDGDPDRFPGNLEICEDGLDQDCDNFDQLCATWLYTVRETDNMLRRHDLQSGTWENIGVLTANFEFGDLAYDESTQTMWMVDGRGALGLHTIDLATGATTLVGIHGIVDLFGLAFDSSTGTLYATSYAWPYALYEMNTTTGAAIFIGNTAGQPFDGLGYDSVRDQLVGQTGGWGDLYTINRNTGAITLLNGAGPWVNNNDICHEPVNDMYWMIDWSGNLYRYNPASGYSQSTYATALGSHDGIVYVANPPN